MIQIIDGNYGICRCVYANSNLKTKSGIPTGGPYLFFKILNSMMSQHGNNCIVVFDGGLSQRRLGLYPHYKEKVRGELTAEQQLEKDVESEKFEYAYSITEEILPYLGIPWIRLRQEADDIIYLLAKELSKKEMVMVHSDDKDYLQFLTIENVLVNQPMKGIIWTKDKFIEEYGFDPKHFTLYKSLIGDGSDNIPGVVGIGDARATSIIKTMIDKNITIREFAELNTSLGIKVKANLSLIKRNMELVDLEKVESHLIEETLDKYNESKKKSVHSIDKLSEIFKKYEFQSLASLLMRA